MKRLYVVELYSRRNKRWNPVFKSESILQHCGWAGALSRSIFTTKKSADAEAGRYGPPCKARVRVYEQKNDVKLVRCDHANTRRANVALIAHWHNVGPKLLKAVKECVYAFELDELTIKQEKDQSGCTAVALACVQKSLEVYRKLVAEAEDVKGI